mgnify:FL=1
MPPYTCPLIDHIQTQFADRPVSLPAIQFQGVILDDLHSMLEALRVANADLRIGCELALELQRENDELRAEIERLRRSL